jgi:hypothetical protein
MGPRISFLVDITGTLPAGITNILSITYREEGSVPVTQTFSIPAFGTIPPPFTQLFTFTSTGANYLGVAATLTVAIFLPFDNLVFQYPRQYVRFANLTIECAFPFEFLQNTSTESLCGRRYLKLICADTFSIPRLLRL